MKCLVSFSLLSILIAAPLVAQNTRTEPVYVYLYARVTDHVNLSITEDRLHRLLPMIERYRKEHPQAHISATMLFSGTVAKALAERNSQTHILDFVKTYIRSGVIEAGYDGSDEPTYLSRPVVDFTEAPNAEQRWRFRKAAEEKFMQEGRDPLTGTERPGSVGGLKEMEDVFGEPACITGLTLPMKLGAGVMMTPVTGSAAHTPAAPKEPAVFPGTMPEVGGDTEAVQLLSYSNKIIMFGVSDTNPARIPGFRGSRAGFSKLMSPVPEAAPEVYWQDNVLRSSEASSEVVRLVHAYAGADAMKKMMETADRTRIHVVHVELADEQNYVSPAFVKSPEFPPLKYAYDHPDHPELPADALLAKSEVDAAFAKEDALLQWLVQDFFSADSGSRFVSSSDLTRLVAPSNGFSISTPELQQSLADFMKSWGNDTFAPPLFRVNGHYLSRAEMFQVLADELAEFHKTGKLPDSVKVARVYGPVRVLTGHGPNVGQVSVETLAGICAEIAPALHDNGPSLVPKNAVPIGIPVSGAMLNPAQFLRLMAVAVINPAPEAKLDIRMAYEFTQAGQLLPRTRPDMDDGFIWTLKPAPIAAQVGARASN